MTSTPSSGWRGAESRELQDRSKWDLEKIAEGRELVADALLHRDVGEYQIQAAISALHAAGLRILDLVADELEAYQPLHAARADLLRRIGQVEGARSAYDRAIELSGTPPERRLLERRRAGLDS